MSNEFKRVSSLLLPWLFLVQACSQAEEPWQFQVVVPIRAEVVFEESWTGIEAWDPAFFVREHGMLYIADRLNSRIVQLSDDGSVNRFFGRGSGRGPGEMVSPSIIRVGSDSSVWVLDQPQGKVIRFSGDGDFLGSIDIMIPAFGLLPDGKVVTRGFTEEGLFIFDESGVAVSVPVGLPADAELPLAVRAATGSLLATNGAGQVVLLDNIRGTLWGIDTRSRSSEWHASDLALPKPINDLALQTSSRRVASIGRQGRGVGVIVPLYKDMRLDDSGRVWLLSGWQEMIGARVDHQRRSVLMVVPSHEREYVGLIGAVMVSDSTMLALYDQKLVLLHLAPVDVPEWTH
jgi:hypothetical protein